MKKFVENVQCCWNDRRYGRLVLYTLFAVLMFALACVGVYLVIQLIARYMDLIMITAAVVLGIYFYSHERSEKLRKEREEAERRELLRQQQLASELAQSNYQLVERAMFIVIQEMHESLRVKNPAFAGHNDKMVTYQNYVFNRYDEPQTENQLEKALCS